jgi:glycosyltransferase involved in cell wall biosynthesis
VTHVAFTGHAQELEAFLKEHSSSLLFIGSPFSYANQKESIATLYEKGIPIAKAALPKTKAPEVLMYFKDFLASFYFIFKFKRKFNVYVGINPLNAIAGLLLKRMGFVQIVIFYVIDYVPSSRFSNKMLNIMYQRFDQICVRHADYTWNLSSAMSDARKERGITVNESSQMTVPTGTRLESNFLPFEQITRTDLAFLSHLREGQGIELILDVMPELIKKAPSVRLLVIGTGPLENHFREEVKKSGLSKNVVFFGYIEDHNKIEKIVSKCGIGIAPYVPDPNSFTWYADPGKPKVYLGCGVPIIITKVPEVATEIQNSNAGIAIRYDKNDLINAILLILENEQIHRNLRQGAIKFASTHTWDEVYLKAFRKILSDNKKKTSRQ